MRIIHILVGKMPNINSNIVRFFVRNAKSTGFAGANQLFYVFETYSNLSEDEKTYYSVPLGPSMKLKFVNPTKLNIFKLFLSLNSRDIVILHSGRMFRIFLMLSLMPWLWKRTALVCFGGELALFKKHYDSKRISDRIIHLSEKRVVPGLRAVCTLTPGEFRIIKSLFKDSNNYFRAFISSTASNSNGTSLKIVGDHNNRYTKVVLNQSANRGGRHREAIDWLAKYKQEKLTIYCPLSFGPRKDAHQIIKYGDENYGLQFKPFLEKLPYNDYSKFVDETDILVLNHLSQAGLGHLYMFLSKGKVAYIREESPVYNMLRDFDIEVRPTNSIPMLSFDEFVKPLSVETAKNNIMQFNKYLSTEASAQSFQELIDFIGKN